jgi:hypothetical protein
LLEQNLHQKRGFILSQVHVESRKNILKNAKTWVLGGSVSLSLSLSTKYFINTADAVTG